MSESEKMKILVSIVFVAGALALGGGVAVAQSGGGKVTTGGKTNKRPDPTPSPPESVTSNDAAAVDDGEVIVVDTQIVSVPVRVLDKKNRFVAGLVKENFKVVEDGVEQEIAMFANEHQPFTVALMLDMSYSTKFKIAEIQSAAISFIDQLRPKDKVMVVSFDGEVRVLCEATTDRKAINKAIMSTRIETGTSLFEAVDVVMESMRRIEGRKAIILFSDGVDTTSKRVTEVDNLNGAMELDSLVYTIRYDTFSDVQKMKNAPPTQPKPIEIPGQNKGGLPSIFTSMGSAGGPGTTAEEYRRAEEYLNQLSIRTGGRNYLADSLGNLTDAFAKIASELREFYSIGYYPTKTRVAGQKTNIKVRVDQPGLVVRAREGYINRQKKETTKR